MIEYYVGIDGGGTSCRARIRDNQGRLLGEAKTGSANILLGVESAMGSVIEAITQAAIQASLTIDDYRYMHVGLALAGAEQRDAWQAFKCLTHPFKSITLNTDAYGACLGAHNGDDGAIMIAGTGSCGLLLLNGEQHVVGGREFPISDQGSGAVMGLYLIQQVLLIQDDIVPDSPLAQEVMSEFNNDIDAIVAWSKTALPRDYGQFCPRVFYFAEQRDTLAVRLLQQTAQDIEMFLNALITKGATRICLMGSIAQRILPWLSPPIQQWIVEPQFDAIEGAIMLAGRPEHNLY
ncbi:BadF/BadG/BcrA/BcrD ATPase family protein [Vibrio astriarenae]|uniref:BadF/BadG/BcrA/BcrD ATPase family protein n=1 Tax=Vibrio astriarenae TaxID=1481923 RepID=UPI00373597DE